MLLINDFVPECFFFSFIYFAKFDIGTDVSFGFYVCIYNYAYSAPLSNNLKVYGNLMIQYGVRAFVFSRSLSPET